MFTKEYVSVREAFRGAKSRFKRLPKWAKIGIALGIALLILGIALTAVVRLGLIVPAAKSLTLKATPYVGEFAANTNITVEIFDKDLTHVATVTLRAPTWSASVTDLNLKDYFYIKAKANGYYWMHWLTSNKTAKLPDGTMAVLINVTAASMSIELKFVKVGSIAWTYTFGMTGLADNVTTTNIIIWKFNVSAYSALDNLTVVAYTNSSELNVTAIIFGGKEYAITNGSKVLISDFFINENATAQEYEIGIKFTENITAPVSVTIKLVYIDETGSEVEVAATEVFS